MSSKLPVALLIYAVIAILAWFTLDAQISVGTREIPLREATLAIVGLFAVRTLLFWYREKHEAAHEGK
ncbi:MAG: hypothetical protein JO187_01770 [Acidobacteria bacterium]|nr:hypothetical protein [Acidobacteriota bacterium]